MNRAIIAAVLAMSLAVGCTDEPPISAPHLARPRLPPTEPSLSLRVASITDLGTLPAPNDWKSVAIDINNSGQVVGWSTTSTGYWWHYGERAPVHGAAPGFTWHAGVMRDISSRYGLPAESLVPLAIANSGHVVFAPVWPWVTPVLWNGGRVNLGDPVGCTETRATGVNDRDEVVGWALCGSDYRALRWTPASGWVTLTGSWGDEYANAISNAGSIVGRSRGEYADPVPAYWPHGGSPRAVGCDDVWSCAGPSEARDINDREWIVGLVYLESDIRPRPFLWTPAGGPELLPLLPGHAWGVALGINNRNHVVGVSVDAARYYRAWVWSRPSGTVPLGELPGGILSLATAINDSGKAVGESEYGIPGRPHAVLWQLTTHHIPFDIESRYPGALSLGDTATLRAILLGSIHLDPSRIDPRSLMLGDQVGQDTPPAKDATGNPLSSLKDVNGDGKLDLVVEFSIPALMQQGDLTKDTTELILWGALVDGTPIDGSRAVKVVP